MRSTRLILIEGLPGSGKSTTAQFVARQLQRQDHPARWFYEQESPHPLPHVDQPNARAHVASSLAAWHTLAADLEQRADTTILESSVFQHAILDLVRADAEHLIDAFADAWYHTIRALQPMLIYFVQADVPAAMRRVCAARGRAWQDHFTQYCTANPYAQRHGWQGFNGALAFMEHYRAICDRLWERFAGPKLQLNNSTPDWTRHQQAIMAFLDQPCLAECALPIDTLQPLVGVYRDPTTAFACEVRLIDQQLALNHVWWPAERFTPLIARDVDRFEVMGAPIELLVAADGAILTLEVAGKWTRCAGAGVDVGTVLHKIAL